MTNKRNYGVDLLRMVLMILIILGHLYAHTEIRSLLPFMSAKWSFTWFTQAITVCAVDCFIIITGYYMSQSEYDIYRLIKLWLKVIFYSVIISIITISNGVINFNVGSLLDAFFPVFRREYWFFTIYILLYILIPFLNVGINKMSKKKHGILVIIILAFFYVEPLFSAVFTEYDPTEGFSIIAFVTIYVIGAYLARCDDIKKKHCIFVLVGSTVFMYASKVVLQIIVNKQGWTLGTGLLYHNNSFLVLINAIALFFLFKQINICQGLQKVVGWINPSVFAVYLLHEKSGMRKLLWNERFVEFLQDSSFVGYIFTVIGIAVAIFAIGILIDKLLQYLLFKKIDRSKIALRIRTLCDRYNKELLS